MRRQARVPGVAELFQKTTPALIAPLAVAPSVPPTSPDQDKDQVQRRAQRPSGRQRHDEKITVYLSSGELVALEEARLALRAEHGIAVDRGRLVRETIAIVLADMNVRGDRAALVQRLANETDQDRPPPSRR